MTAKVDRGGRERENARSRIGLAITPVLIFLRSSRVFPLIRAHRRSLRLSTLFRDD